jgi:hypothetical protein
MLLSRLKGKGHSITCHTIQKEGFKLYLHSFLTTAIIGLVGQRPTPGRSLRTYVTGCAPGQVWTGMANRIFLALTAFGTQDIQACSEWTTV